MKIGILTFHRADNYGAVLQCYALQTYLRKIWDNVEVVDYRQPAIERTYNALSAEVVYKWKFHPLRLLRYVKGSPRRWMRRHLFDKFRKKYLLLSKPFSGKKTLAYDLLIHGSDQIWNPKLTGGIPDRVYLGFYDIQANAKKVTYAVSFENKPIPQDEIGIYAEGLKNFSAISLREQSLAKLLEPLTDKKLSVVADPTLLLSREDFDVIAEDLTKKRKYVLVYAVGPKDLALHVARRIAAERHLEIIDITDKEMSPGLFVGYFKQADFIVAVSFHGTVFSLLYNKSFYTIATGMTSDVRYHDLLDKFGMPDRCITRMPDKITDVDYSEFENNKERMVQASRDFIANTCK